MNPANPTPGDGAMTPAPGDGAMTPAPGDGRARRLVQRFVRAIVLWVAKRFAPARPHALDVKESDQ
jgi:hypothetical protein